MRERRCSTWKSGPFTQPDPIGLAGGLNLYGYAGGDPINHSDPFGLCKRPSGSGVGICLESFISAGTVFGMPVGDGRGPQGNGGSFKTSQRFSIDVETGAISGLQQEIGKTMGIAGVGALSVSPAVRTKDGGWNIGVSGNVQSKMMPDGMDITFSFTLNVDKSGTVSVVGGEFDSYPSFEVWSYGANGGANKVVSYPEGNISGLAGAAKRTVIPPHK